MTRLTSTGGVTTTNIKSNKIKKARNQHPGMDSLVVESIKNGDIERAMDLRDQLPVVCASPVVLKRFAEGKVTLADAHERAVDSGADSVPYKRATAFRKWITEPEIDTLLASCPSRVVTSFSMNFGRLHFESLPLRKNIHNRTRHTGPAGI